LSLTRSVAIGLVVAAGVCLAAAPAARAQELEPRAYSLSPVGTNFAAVILGNLSGGILFDPTVPITDAKGDIDLATLGYGRTFGLGGHLGLVTVVLPAAYGHFEGQVQEQARSVRRRGFADLRLKASLNLLGGAVMTPEEFAKAPRRTVLGVALTVQAPTGQYDEAKLINLGTNR